MMELSLATPIGSNAGIFRRTKSSFTKVAPRNKCGGNWTREVSCLVAHGGGGKSVTRHGVWGPLGQVSKWASKAKEGYLWARTGSVFALSCKGPGPSETFADKYDLFPKNVLEAFGVLIGFVRPYILHMTILGLAINKPRYTLASGALSIRCAWILVTSFIIIGITISILLKSGSVIAYVLCHLILGPLYSIPPFSIKRSTIGAIFFCALCRGFVFNIGLAALAKTIMGLSFHFSLPEISVAIFATLFIGGTTALKDIEDLEGDKKYDVPTLASIHGPRKVAIFGFAYMLMIYIGAIALALFMPKVFRRSIMIPSHIFLALCLIFQAWKLEKANYTKEASVSMFQSMLKLYTVEFMLFPFI